MTQDVDGSIASPLLSDGTPTEIGWYWIRDAELVKGSPWVLAHLDSVFPRRKMRLFTPDNNQEVWHMVHDGDGGWYTDLESGDTGATECQPIEWIKIDEPKVG